MRRMLHDENAASPEDRAATCLVLLYAQPVSKIVSLTTDDLDVTDIGTYVLGESDHVPLPLGNSKHRSGSLVMARSADRPEGRARPASSLCRDSRQEVCDGRGDAQA